MTFWKPKKIFQKKRVYADAAASTPLGGAARAEAARLRDIFANPGGLHREGVKAKDELERARASVAASIGAHADEIVFVGSGTEANNLALHAACWHAITTPIEHLSVLEPLRHSAADVVYALTAEEIKNAITSDTTLVSVGLVNSEVGLVQPVHEIAKSIRHSRTPSARALRAARPSLTLALWDAAMPLLHTDASQAPLWLTLNVEKLGIDLMTLDAHKIMGPKGVGALYIKRGTPVEPLLWGGGQEGGVRSGTENVAAAAAFAAALVEAQAGVEERAARIAAIRDYLWEEIKHHIPDVVLNGPELQGRSLKFCRRVANNLNVSVPGLESQMAVVAMDALGVAVSTKSACSAGDEEPSHVIKILHELAGAPPELAGTAVRITLLPDATRADADYIAAALAEAAARYRKR